MNKQELFIKYLDEQLSQNELKEFDTKLLEDSNFKNQFLEFRNKYENLRAGISIDERYFNTLIPNSKAQEKKTKKKSVLKFAYAMPVVLFILIVSISNFKNESNSSFTFSDFLDEITIDNELTTQLLSNTFNIEDNFILEDELIAEYYAEELDIDESIFEYLENNTSTEDINNNLLEELSDDEFLSLQKELIDKKIL